MKYDGAVCSVCWSGVPVALLPVAEQFSVSLRPVCLPCFGALHVEPLTVQRHGYATVPESTYDDAVMLAEYVKLLGES